MPSSYTTNYQLSQWERSDKIQMDDFNADNAKIDAALKAEADARTALAAEVAKCGNCSIGIFSYYGTNKYGQDNPTTITFPRMPAAFIVFGPSASLIGRGGQSQALVDSFGLSGGAAYTTSLTLTWSGTSCTFFANYADRHQLNEYGPNTVIAFYAEN